MGIFQFSDVPTLSHCGTRYSGVLSLTIIIVSALFVGMVLGLTLQWFTWFWCDGFHWCYWHYH
ncbi:MAG: hypothetical protein R3E08_12400 [Thiotrichaceae bacterium]